MVEDFPSVRRILGSSYGTVKGKEKDGSVLGKREKEVRFLHAFSSMDPSSDTHSAGVSPLSVLSFYFLRCIFE